MACNRELLVVSLKNQLLLHALGDLAPLHAFSTFPSPSPMAVLALSRSWLAYPSWQPLRPDAADGVNIAPANSFGSPYVDLGVGVAGSVKTLGEMGAQSIRTLSSYMSSSPPVACSPLRQPSTEFAGTVTVRDAASGETVLSFRAHDAPIVFLRFDPASSLLVTAAVDGHNINLFLLPEFAAGGAAPPPRHLYRLVRGVTASTIRDIALSADLRWISVTSSHGTAHVYAINPDGCAPAADTHAPEPLTGPACALPCCALEKPGSVAGSPRSKLSSRPTSARSARSGASLLSEGAAPPLTLFAVTRIRGGDGAAPRGLGDAPVACTKFALGSPAQFGAAGGVGAVYVVSGDGALSRCLLTPPRRADPNGGGGGDALLLTTERQGTFDICRRRRWEEQKCPPELLAAFGAEDAGAPRSPVGAGRPCLRCAQAGCLSRAQSRAPGGADAGSAAGDGAAGAGDTLDEDFLLVEAPRRAQEARLSTSAPSASRNPFMDARAGPPLLCAGGSPEVPRPLSFSFRAAAAGSCAGIYGGLPSPSPGSSPADGGVMGGMMAALVLGAGGAAGPRGHPARGVRSLRVSEQRSSDESESGDEGAGGGARDGAEEEDLAREMMFEIDDLDGDGAADVGGEGTSRARQAGGSGSLGASGGVCLDRESAVVGEEDRDALRREADGGDEAEQGPQSADWEAQCEEDAQSQDWEAESDAAPQGEEVKRERGQIVPIACADPCETGKAAYDDAAPPGGDGAILATSPPEEALGVSPTEGAPAPSGRVTPLEPLPAPSGRVGESRW